MSPEPSFAAEASDFGPARQGFTLAERRGIAAVAVLVMLGVAYVLAADAAHQHRVMVPAGRHRYPHWMRGIFNGLGGSITVYRLLELTLVMIAAYVVLLLVAEAVPLRWMIGAVVALNAVFFLAPPILSADIFGYIDFARLGSLHGLNPYAHDARAFPGDPAYRYVLWHNTTTPYGPLFTLASYVAAIVSVPLAMWGFKGLAFVCCMGCLWLIVLLRRRLGRPVTPAVAFFGANPILLVWGIGGGHNDFLMMLVVLAGVWFVVAGREASGALAAIAGVGVKAAAAVFVPFFAIGMRDRVRAVAWMAGAALVVGLVALIAFGTKGLSGFAGVFGTTQQKQVAFHSVPNEIGRIVGLGGATTGLRHALAIAGGLIVLGLIWWAWRGADWIRAAGWAALTILFASAWLVSWYVIWPLSFAAVAEDKRLRWTIIAFCGLLVVWRWPQLSH